MWKSAKAWKHKSLYSISFNASLEGALAQIEPLKSLKSKGFCCWNSPMLFGSTAPSQRPLRPRTRPTVYSTSFTYHLKIHLTSLHHVPPSHHICQHSANYFWYGTDLYIPGVGRKTSISLPPTPKHKAGKQTLLTNQTFEGHLLEQDHLPSRDATAHFEASNFTAFCFTVVVSLFLSFLCSPHVPLSRTSHVSYICRII